jgi:membrane-associated phospholipid phosphatase
MNEIVRPVEHRRSVRRLWRAETIYVVSLTGFAVLALLAHIYAYFGWDLQAASALQSVPGLYPLMRAVSVIGNGLIPFVLTAVTFVLLWVLKLRHEAYGLLLSAGGGEIVNRLLKLIVDRPRPASDLVTIFRIERTESFPSGHVSFYICYFGFLFFVSYALLPRGSVARRVAMALCIIPIVLIGFSRVYLGAHWPSDILGAYLSAGMWLAFSLHFYRRWKEAARK